MLHCNDIDPFVTLKGSFNWGPILRNDIVSSGNIMQKMLRDRSYNNAIVHIL